MGRVSWARPGLRAVSRGRQGAHGTLRLDLEKAGCLSPSNFGSSSDFQTEAAHELLRMIRNEFAVYKKVVESAKLRLD